MEQALLDILRNDYLSDFYISTEILYQLNNNNRSFWDPVIVCLSTDQINKLVNVVSNEECIICSEPKNYFKEVSCCKNKICDPCCNKWFSSSVKCPFCKHDLRN